MQELMVAVMVLRFDVFIISSDECNEYEFRNSEMRRDDHEFAIFAEFIFTCDSMNICAINIYLI